MKSVNGSSRLRILTRVTALALTSGFSSKVMWYQSDQTPSRRSWAWPPMVTVTTSPLRSKLIGAVVRAPSFLKACRSFLRSRSRLPSCQPMSFEGAICSSIAAISASAFASS